MTGNANAQASSRLFTGEHLICVLPFSFTGGFETKYLAQFPVMLLCTTFLEGVISKPTISVSSIGQSFCPSPTERTAPILRPVSHDYKVTDMTHRAFMLRRCPSPQHLILTLPIVGC